LAPGERGCEAKARKQREPDDALELAGLNVACGSASTAALRHRRDPHQHRGDRNPFDGAWALAGDHREDHCEGRIGAGQRHDDRKWSDRQRSKQPKRGKGRKKAGHRDQPQRWPNEANGCPADDDPDAENKEAGGGDGEQSIDRADATARKTRQEIVRAPG